MRLSITCNISQFPNISYNKKKRRCGNIVDEKISTPPAAEQISGKLYNVKASEYHGTTVKNEQTLTPKQALKCLKRLLKAFHINILN